MSARLEVDLDLVRKYDVPGPRYTSYPTAVEFGSDFAESDLLSDLRNTGKTPKPLSLYVHLPFARRCVGSAVAPPSSAVISARPTPTSIAWSENSR